MLLASCGEPPQRMSNAFFEGELRLTGELAQAESGYVFISARPRGVRSPLLARRYDVSSKDFKAKGDAKVLSYELTAADSMVGTEVTLPPNVELKAYFDPDGFVETKDGIEAIIVQCKPGERAYSMELRPGMPVPDEPPSSLPGPDSRPTSQPANE